MNIKVGETKCFPLLSMSQITRPLFYTMHDELNIVSVIGFYIYADTLEFLVVKIYVLQPAVK